MSADKLHPPAHKGYPKPIDFDRRVKVEQTLLDVANGKAPMLTREECRQLAHDLGIPDEYRNAAFVGMDLAAPGSDRTVEFVVTVEAASDDPKWVVVNNVDEMKAHFLSRLPAIRQAAVLCGYAIGAHGSQRRDFDLIAVPWAESYKSRDELAAKIMRAACGMQSASFQWEEKPNGRFATVFPVCMADFSYDLKSLGHVDLSVVAPVGPVGGMTNAELSEAIQRQNKMITATAINYRAPLEAHLAELMNAEAIRAQKEKP